MWPRILWKPHFYIKSHFLHISRNQEYDIPAYIHSALPSLHSVPGNYQCGLPKEYNSTTVHCCFCLWLTLPEQTMSHPVQQKRVGGCPARSVSRHPALPTHSMGPDFTEGAEPGTGHCQWRSVQMCPSLSTKATLASSHFLCRGVISTLVCKTPPCSRLQPSQPASPAASSALSRQPRTLCQGYQAVRHSGLAKCSICRSIELWPWVLAPTQRGGISSACCKQLQGGGGETSTARLCSSQKADGSLSLLRNRAPRHEGRPKSIHFPEGWALKTCALCTTVV